MVDDDDVVDDDVDDDDCVVVSVLFLVRNYFEPKVCTINPSALSRFNKRNRC